MYSKMKMMKTVVWVVAVIIMLMLAMQSNAQVKTNLTHLVDAVVAKAKAHGLNSKDVKWDSIQTQMHEYAKQASSVHDLKQSFEMLLLSLNDKRGAFYDPTNSAHVAAHPDIHPHSSVGKEIAEAQFEYRILANDVRYIKLVSVASGSDIQKQSELIRAAVDSLSKEEATYWIVDLRYVTGGEMKPLMAGLAPLLDEGLIASSSDSKKQIKNLYTVHNGNFYDNQVPVAKFPIFKNEMRNAKIAVLTSRYTTGAGEILTLAFKGRKNTRVIGETTAGFIAGTASITISHNLVMSISEIMYTDRRGNAYAENLNPHTFIPFTPGVGLNEDKSIAEATLWLTTTSVSAASAKVTMN
jgi:carboxyl-terminal processing protease